MTIQALDRAINLLTDGVKVAEQLREILIDIRELAIDDPRIVTRAVSKKNYGDALCVRDLIQEVADMVKPEEIDK